MICASLKMSIRKAGLFTRLFLFTCRSVLALLEHTNGQPLLL